MSEKVRLERGVIQSDPLSPLLYVLFVEVLAPLIRRSPAIEGFLSPGASCRQARVRLYADDTTHRAKENPQSLEIDVLKKLKPLRKAHRVEETEGCLLYTSDAADE